MTEISSAKRAIIIQYRFYHHLTFQDISRRLTDVSAEAAKMICFRASKRANSTNIDSVLEHCDPLPRSGAHRRVEPGSEAAIRIREEVHGRGRFQTQEDAANSAFQRVTTGHTTTACKPLGELDAKQVYNIT
jgi:hypothetical protein